MKIYLYLNGVINQPITGWYSRTCRILVPSKRDFFYYKHSDDQVVDLGYARFPGVYYTYIIHI